MVSRLFCRRARACRRHRLVEARTAELIAVARCDRRRDDDDAQGLAGVVVLHRGTRVGRIEARVEEEGAVRRRLRSDQVGPDIGVDRSSRYRCRGSPARSRTAWCGSSSRPRSRHAIHPSPAGRPPAASPVAVEVLPHESGLVAGVLQPGRRRAALVEGGVPTERSSGRGIAHDAMIVRVLAGQDRRPGGAAQWRRRGATS